MANGWWSYSDMEEIKNSFLNGKNPKEIANEREENELAITMYLITENLLPANAVLDCKQKFSFIRRYELKLFKYEIELINDNDRSYYKTGIIISENKEDAQIKIYEYYDNRTTDYVSHNVLLNEIHMKENLIIEDQ